MQTSSWPFIVASASFIVSTLAIPTPSPDIAPVNGDPFSAHLGDGVTAFVRSFPSGGDWQLNYEDVANEVNQITGGATKGLTDLIKQALGVETSSKVVNSNGNQATAPPPPSHGTLSGRVYLQLANEGSEYLATVQIGTKTFNVNLDTGSSDTWVFSTKLPADEQTNHTIYNPALSSSYAPAPSSTFNVAYGDNTSLTGPVANEMVSIANIPAKSQSIALPTFFSAGILDDPSDGIIGLGFQSLNSICSMGGSTSHSSSGPPSTSNKRCPGNYVRDPQPTWFESVKSSLVAGLFAVNLKFNTIGYFEFGRYDSSEYHGDLNFVPVNNAGGFWQFPSRSYRVGGQGQPIAFNGQDGIADTGTSLLKLDQTVVDAYYAQVPTAQPGVNGWTFPCDTKLPDLEIALGNYLATVDGQSLNYTSTTTGACYGGLQASARGTPQIFGDTFFKANFVVFDYDGMRIGVAPHS